MTWRIEFYRTSSGKSPVNDFIDSLQPVQKGKIINAIDLLEKYGLYISIPHSKKLSGFKNLFELRTSGKSPVRLLYMRRQDTFLILHGFIKKSPKTPPKEISTALKRSAI